MGSEKGCLSLEDKLIVDKAFNSSPEFEIGSFICFVYENLITYKREGFCYGIIPPLPTPESRKKFLAKENAEIYLVKDQLAIFSTTHNAYFVLGVVELPEAELEELRNSVFVYKEQTKRLPEHLLSTSQRRFSPRYDCGYVDAFLKMWRNTKFDYTHERLEENGINPLFVRHDGLNANLSDKNRERLINKILAQKEMVGSILLLPEYHLREPGDELKNTKTIEFEIEVGLLKINEAYKKMLGKDINDILQNEKQ